jgi:excisionase family DNA binding protein
MTVMNADINCGRVALTAAEYHRVDIKTIRRYIQQGHIKAYRLGPRMLPLDRDSVVNLGRRVGGQATTNLYHAGQGLNICHCRASVAGR